MIAQNIFDQCVNARLQLRCRTVSVAIGCGRILCYSIQIGPSNAVHHDPYEQHDLFILKYDTNSNRAVESRHATVQPQNKLKKVNKFNLFCGATTVLYNTSNATTVVFKFVFQTRNTMPIKKVYGT